MADNDIALATAGTEYRLCYPNSRRVVLSFSVVSPAGCVVRWTKDKGLSGQGVPLNPDNSPAILSPLEGDKTTVGYFAQSDTNTTVVQVHEEFI